MLPESLTGVIHGQSHLAAFSLQLNLLDVTSPGSNDQVFWNIHQHLNWQLSQHLARRRVNADCFHCRDDLLYAVEIWINERPGAQLLRRIRRNRLIVFKGSGSQLDRLHFHSKMFYLSRLFARPLR
jgi:hypothetical protein